MSESYFFSLACLCTVCIVYNTGSVTVLAKVVFYPIKVLKLTIFRPIYIRDNANFE